MNSILLQPYFEMLKKHTSHIQVPGLKRNYSIPLAEIFIQPNVAVPSADIDTEEQAKARSGRKNEEKEKEPKPVLPAPLEPALAVLSRENQIVVLGEAGQGKSTLLRQYAFELAAVNAELPLFVELGQKREWTASSPGEYTWLRERIPAAPRDKLRDEAWRAFCDALDQHRATLILDGLDELTEEARGQVFSLIETLKGNRLIISSRPQAYSPLSGFKVYKLALLDSEQVDSLATNFCRAMANERDLTDHTSALNKVLETAYSKGWAMVQNPLLLYFICLAAFSEESIPSRPAPLIGKCIAELVRWEQRRPGSMWPKPEEFGAEDVIRILSQVALSSFSQTTDVVSEAALGRVLPDEKDRMRFRELLVPAGLIEQTENGYKFILDTFREYYAARAIVADKNPFGRVKRQLHLPEWQRVILYTAGSLKDEKANWFHLKFPILTTMFVNVIGPVVRIGGGLIGLAAVPKPIADAGREGLKETASAIQGPLETWLHRSRHSTEFFITSIWKHHCRRRWLRYERILCRDLRLAACCLAEIEAGPDRMVAPLADSILNKCSEECAIAVKNPNVRRNWLGLTKITNRRYRAVRALESAVRQPEVRDRLLELFPDKDMMVRLSIVRSLARVATHPEVQDRLLKLMDEDSDDDMTSYVTAVLIRSENVNILKRFLKMSLDDEAQHKQQMELLKVTDKNFIDTWRVSLDIIKSIQERQRYLKKEIDATEKGRPSRPTPFRKREISENEEDLILERIGPHELERLVRLARDKNPHVRIHAVRSLVAHRTQPEVLTALLGLTSGMAWEPLGRLIKAVPGHRWSVFFLCCCTYLLFHRFAPEALGPWAKWIVFVFFVSSPWLLSWIIGRMLRRGRSKYEMGEVAESAIKALQNWKDDISRFTLWRVGNLARVQLRWSTTTLAAMLQVWEHQQFRDSSR